jgi:hypothetical protein
MLAMSTNIQLIVLSGQVEDHQIGSIVTFLILVALAGAARYGCEVIREVETLSAGRVSLLPSTLSSVLDRFVAQVLIEVDPPGCTLSRPPGYSKAPCFGGIDTRPVAESRTATLDGPVLGHRPIVNRR